jgi:hypothetical protein
MQELNNKGSVLPRARSSSRFQISSNFFSYCALAMTKSLCRARSPPNPLNRACPPNHASALQSAVHPKPHATPPHSPPSPASLPFRRRSLPLRRTWQWAGSGSGDAELGSLLAGDAARGGAICSYLCIVRVHSSGHLPYFQLTFSRVLCLLVVWGNDTKVLLEFFLWYFDAAVGDEHGRHQPWEDRGLLLISMFILKQLAGSTQGTRVMSTGDTSRERAVVDFYVYPIWLFLEKCNYFIYLLMPLYFLCILVCKGLWTSKWNMKSLL